MIKLEPFTTNDFERLITWVDTPELLMQIAGPNYSFPLTVDQLQNYLEDPTSYSFNIIDTSEENIIGHAEIILSPNGTCKLDKILIGDKSHRGKGYGRAVVHELLKYSFDKPGVNEVELNVFDWNVAGLKCYEKAGFIINPNKKMTVEINNEIWTALNMSIAKAKWQAIV